MLELTTWYSSKHWDCKMTTFLLLHAKYNLGGSAPDSCYGTGTAWPARTSIAAAAAAAAAGSPNRKAQFNHKHLGKPLQPNVQVWVAAKCMGTWCWVAAMPWDLSSGISSSASETKSTCAAVDRAATTSSVVASRSGHTSSTETLCLRHKYWHAIAFRHSLCLWPS